MTDHLDRAVRATSMRQGRPGVANVLQIKNGHDPAYTTYQGQRIVIDDDWVAGDGINILHKLEYVFRSSPTMDMTSDLARCQAESSVRRALVLHAHGALEGKDVLLLGDDDLVSLAIGFLGQARGAPLARRIVVVETDPAWIDLIRATLDRERLGIECVRHDLRDPLPEGLRGQFDTFETNPPYTRAGIALFVSRAIQALRPGAGQQGLLSLEHNEHAELHDVRSHLARMGLATWNVIVPIQGSASPSASDGASQMIYLSTTPATRALVPPVPYEGAIYAGQAAQLVRFCVCTRCKARYRVGQQYSFVTLESLKAAGCTNCGHTRFRHVRRIAVQPNRLPPAAVPAATVQVKHPWSLPAAESFV